MRRALNSCRVRNERYRALQMWIAALMTPCFIALGLTFLLKGLGTFFAIWYFALAALSAAGAAPFGFVGRGRAFRQRKVDLVDLVSPVGAQIQPGASFVGRHHNVRSTSSGDRCPGLAGERQARSGFRDTVSVCDRSCARVIARDAVNRGVVVRVQPI